ncbi:MAG: VWA domain-containing protein [Silvibacterium sp.]
MKTTVNRVLLDVLVTDAHGNPVHDLTRDDFTVQEDGRPQRVLSFDAHNFDGGMDYTPPNLPPLRPNTFVNLPSTPVRGPLYVLYYDLVNIPIENQVFARKQLVKFITEKPAGARYAIFVSSDDVHLVQGFTSNQQELFAAIDPKSSRPHVPEIFLMGTNFGQGDKLATASRLSFIARYLAGLPGRKNLIWLASEFPLSLFPTGEDTDAYREEVKRTLDLLADNQIAVYPVDTSGVVLTEVYAPSGAAGDSGIATDVREKGIVVPLASQPGGNSKSGAGAAPPVNKFAGGPGVSLTVSSYMVQDEIARVTGGEAIYSSNNVQQSLARVTENGGNYYTLSYSPTNKNYNGALRHIHVQLAENEYHLSYRRAYYGIMSDAPSAETKSTKDNLAQKSGDPFSAYMEHGAPTVHQLVFGVHLRTLGLPAQGTREQMESIARQTTLMNANDKLIAKSLRSVPLQTYAIDYTVMARQLQTLGETAPDIEIAAAAYDSDGRLLNATVNKVAENKTSAPGKSMQEDAYRMEQRIDAPLAAKFIRVAVRDAGTGRIGAMEISLPLAPENPAPHIP